MNDYYQEDAEIVDSSNPRTGLLFLAAIVGFFIFLAIAVPAIKAAGGSTDSLVFAVFGAVAGAILLPVLLNAILSKLHLKGKTRRELLESLVGYTPMYDFDETETLMLPSTVVNSFYDAIPDERALVPYAGDSEYFDDEDDDSTESAAIIEENPMQLADDYQPNIDGFLSSKVTVIGITGSGKSNAVAVLTEELGYYGVPLLLADTEDEYAPLASHKYLPRGIRAGSLELLRINPDLARQNFIAVDIEGAYVFGQTILEEGLQVVLNLKSYPYEMAAQLMINIIRGMNDWEDAHHKDPVSCTVILDEAHKWLPQRSDESELSKETLQALQVAIFDTLVRRGRKRGLGLILATQRVAELDKRGLQSQWRFLFRQTERGDLNYYRSLGLDTDEVPTLGNGECYVYSPTLQGWLIQFRRRYSPHGANTPGLASVLAHRQTLRPLSALSTRSFAGSSAAVTTLDPDTDALPVPAPTFTVPATPAPKRIDLTPYAEAWNAGAKSIRKLQPMCDPPTYYEASRIYGLLREARLIEVKR